MFWTNYLLLLNEKPLNFTIYRNTQLEEAISGPDRAPILQAQIWARSGRAFHYWSGARQINLSGPHFSRSGPDQRLTKISARVFWKRSIRINIFLVSFYLNFSVIFITVVTARCIILHSQYVYMYWWAYFKVHIRHKNGTREKSDSSTMLFHTMSIPLLTFHHRMHTLFAIFSNAKFTRFSKSPNFVSTQPLLYQAYWDILSYLGEDNWLFIRDFNLITFFRV